MRVVVVGAGVGGLAAAARLATLGHEVTVCERAPVTGGKLGSYHRDGFTFDTGPSLLTLPQAFRDLFLKTGDPLESIVDLQPVDPVARYRFSDGTTLDLPTGSIVRTRDAIDDALGEGTGQQWAALLERAGAIWQATRVPFVESPVEGIRTLARLALQQPRDITTIAPWRSLRGLGRRYLDDPRLRTLLDRYATYSGSDPRRAPAALAVVPYVEHAFGGWYVTGGLHRLGRAIHDRVIDRGATIRCSTEVTGIEVSGGSVQGVALTDGGRLPADVVIANADASLVYGSLLGDGKGAARYAPTSYSGFVLLLALRGRTPGLAHHTVLFPDDYDAEFDALAHGRVVQEPTVYVAAPDDPAVRPDDEHEAMFVLVNAPRHEPEAGVDWDEPNLADRYADRVLDVMAERGLDVRDRLLWRVVRTPADLARDANAPGGAIYGRSSDGWRSAVLRPTNRSSVRGLFLVGGSAHPGGGLPLVALSAAIVAEMVGPT